MDTQTTMQEEVVDRTVTEGEDGPKTTGRGPLPPYIPSVSGLIEESIEVII